MEQTVIITVYLDMLHYVRDLMCATSLGVHIESTCKVCSKRGDSLPIDLSLSAVSVMVIVQSSLEIPERLMDYVHMRAEQAWSFIPQFYYRAN